VYQAVQETDSAFPIPRYSSRLAVEEKVMALNLPRAILEGKYDEAARDYLRRLPLEHFMEAIPQATQCEITLESLALVRARRPDFHVFNELLIQYDLPKRRKPAQIVPDNMVVISSQPIKATTSFNVPLEPIDPFWVMEYVSKGSKRKDYEKSFQKYKGPLLSRLLPGQSGIDAVSSGKGSLRVREAKRGGPLRHP
jgi:hypothetical protein